VQLASDLPIGLILHTTQVQPGIRGILEASMTGRAARMTSWILKHDELRTGALAKVFPGFFVGTLRRFIPSIARESRGCRNVGESCVG